jgi:hypothetical protein
MLCAHLDFSWMLPAVLHMHRQEQQHLTDIGLWMGEFQL